MSAAGMNNPSPAPARTLDRLNTPVEVIGRQFIKNRQPVELTIRSNNVRSVGKYLEVADVEGTTIFQIKNKVLTLHNRTFLHDAAGKVMLTLRQKMKTVHGRWEVFRREDEEDLLFTAERSSAFRKNARIHIFLPSNTTQEIPDYKIDGSWSDNSFIVSPGGSNTILAEITVQKGRNIATKITVKVAPNVDYAFMATLVIFLGSFDPPVWIRSTFRYTFVGVQVLLAVLGAGLTL